MRGEMTRMRFEHVVFDIDGTLLDTKDTVFDSLQEAVRRMHGIVMPVSRMPCIFGITALDGVMKLGIPAPRETTEYWTETVMPEYLDRTRVFDGIPAVLAAIRAKNIAMGIVTSRSRAQYETDFVPFGLAAYFDYAVTSDDTARHKPSGDPLREYMAHQGADARKTLYVGDSAFDMACAQGAGVAGALAMWGSLEPQGIRAMYYPATPNALLDILQ